MIPSLRAMRRAGMAALLLVFLLTAACGGSSTSSGPTPTPMLPQRVVYVGPDHAIFTVNPDGTDIQRLLGAEPDVLARQVSTGEAQVGPTIRYFWPTWSPTGEHLAVSRIPGTAADSPASLMVLRLQDMRLEPVHDNPPGSRLVAPDAPHYIHWSPDGRHLTFIAPTNTGLTLYLATLGDPKGPQPVTSRAPLYFAWRQDSSALLIHQGDQLFAYALGDDRPDDLDQPSPLYRAPAFSPSGERMAFVSQASDVPTITLRTEATGQEMPLVPVTGSSAFLWSPAGDQLAVATVSREDPAFYDGLDLVDTLTGEQRRLVRGPVMAFFWSPDGQRLAVVRHVPDIPSLEWLVVEPTTGESRILTRFLPSRDQLTPLTFFDQYAVSHSPWSANSTRLLFAGTALSGNGSRPTGEDRVYIVNAAGQEPPKSVAAGGLAFWVPTTAP